jgi:predicted nucleic acid-binding protein
VIFLDSNILLYAAGLNGTRDRRTRLARELIARDEPFVISVQVLQEFYDRATRGRGEQPRLPRDQALGFLEQWRSFAVVPVTVELFDRATQIEARYGYRYWDSAILAAAALSGCDTLLSEDMQDGQMVDAVRIVNPFRDSP